MSDPEKYRTDDQRDKEVHRYPCEDQYLHVYIKKKENEKEEIFIVTTTKERKMRGQDMQRDYLVA